MLMEGSVMILIIKTAVIVTGFDTWPRIRMGRSETTICSVSQNGHLHFELKLGFSEIGSGAMWALKSVIYSNIIM